MGSWVSYVLIEKWGAEEVWRALKWLELLLAKPRAICIHLSRSPTFPRASYLDERTLTQELILFVMRGVCHYGVMGNHRGFYIYVTISWDKRRSIADLWFTKQLEMANCTDTGKSVLTSHETIVVNAPLILTSNTGNSLVLAAVLKTPGLQFAQRHWLYTLCSLAVSDLHRSWLLICSRITWCCMVCTES